MRRARVHANFAEYVPMALVLLACAESLKAPAIALHGLGVVLVAGRIIHAYGLSQNPHNFRLRVLGMWLTMGTIALLATLCFSLAGLNLLV